MRFIDADKLLEHAVEADRMGAMLVVGIGYIFSAPSADVAPVRRGEWIDTEIIHGIPYATCSECGIRCARDFIPENMGIGELFCKSCGAKMRREDTDGR
jgi:hypothetical protein